MIHRHHHYPDILLLRLSLAMILHTSIVFDFRARLPNRQRLTTNEILLFCLLLRGAISHHHSGWRKIVRIKGARGSKVVVDGAICGIWLAFVGFGV